MMKLQENSINELLSIAYRALKVSLKTKSKASLFVTLIGFPMALMPLAVSVSLGRFTDHIQSFSQQKGSLQTVLLSLLVLITLYVLQAIYTYQSDYYSAADKHSTAKYIKKTMIDCTAHVEYKYIDNAGDFREKLAFAEMFGGERVAQSMQQLMLILRQFITFASIVYALSAINLWIVVILLITCVPAIILSMLQKDEVYREKAKSMNAAAMSVHLFYIASGANERCRSMNDMRFCGAFPWIKNRWREVSEGYLREKKFLSRKHLIYNSIADLLRNGVFIGVLLISAKGIYENPQLGLGSFMLILTLSGQLQTSTTRVFAGVANFIGDHKYMRDYFELSDTPTEEIDDSEPAPKNFDITFEHVSFGYPNSTRLALKDVNITINQGERIAIVGENGSGKSTFISLLCGLYNPDSGSVSVGRKEVKNHLGGVRKALSVAYQNFGRYEATIRENVTVSDIEKKTTDEEINKMIKLADGNAVVDTQKQGLDEEVGSFSKTGNDLSGGQWQKLAIARALYRDQAKIMILDEPTSALDPIAEAHLYADFSQLTADKTTILISHRLGVTSLVDRILVFEDGQIVEDGTHEQLLELNGRYRQMYEAQVQWYR